MIEDLYEKYLACACKVTTDSRSISGGEIFFALKGDKFDGNAYALKALESGAAWAVVDDQSLPEDERLIRVEDSYAALRDLAVYHRTHVRDGKLPVIGLTGTNGKTTTKELIAAVLSAKYRVTATKGNLNNDIGVPLSILSITPDTEIAVIEMGASHPDDIAKLVPICSPDYGLITNVGKAHLLGFGSFDGVKAAKGELYKWLGSHRGSLIFINEDDDDLRGMASAQPCHFFGYGLKYQGAEILPASPDSPFLSIKLGAGIIRTKLVGAYNATNVLAALAVGEYFGVNAEAAAAAVEAYEPKNNRSQMTRTADNVLIVDAYNANPSSMAASLDNFILSQAEKKYALLGDMRELGEDSLKEHVVVVTKLRDASLNAFLVGAEFGKALDCLNARDEFPWFEDSSSLASYLSVNRLSGALLLVKGSRSVEMEKVIPSL